MKIYALFGESGEYDNYSRWLVGLFSSPREALLHADSLIKYPHVWYHHKEYSKDDSYEENIRIGYEKVSTKTINYTSHYRECWIDAYDCTTYRDEVDYTVETWRVNEILDRSNSDFWEKDKHGQVIREEVDPTALP